MPEKKAKDGTERADYVYLGPSRRFRARADQPFVTRGQRDKDGKPATVNLSQNEVVWLGMNGSHAFRLASEPEPANNPEDTDDPTAMTAEYRAAHTIGGITIPTVAVPEALAPLVASKAP